MWSGELSSERIALVGARMAISNCVGVCNLSLIFGKPKAALDRQCLSENPPTYRSAVAAAPRRTALAQLKSNKEFMAKLRADKTRLQAGFVAIDPATGTSKRGSAAATSKPTSSITCASAGGNRVRRLSRLFTAPRSSRGCQPTNASSTKPSKFLCPTAPCGALPMSRSRPAGR